MTTLPSLTQSFESAGVPLNQRDAVVALAAARRVGYSLPMPPEKVGSPTDYYKANLAAQAEESLGEMNEVAVMDFDFAAKAALLFWLARYKVLFDPDSSEAMQAVQGLVESLLNKETVSDLGFVQDPHGGSGTAVIVVDGRTTLGPVADYVQGMESFFDMLWPSESKEG